MKDRRFSLSARGLRWPRAQVWAPVLAVVLVMVMVWVSFFSGPRPTSTATDRSGAGTTEVRSDVPQSERPDGDRTAGGDDPGDAGDAGAGPGQEPGKVEDERAAAALDRSVRRFRAAQRRLAERVSQQLEKREKREQRAETHVFRVATYNILGDSHTGPGGNKPGYPDAGPRMDMSIAALRNNGIDVVGFQEFESTQHAMFSARAGEYAVYPGMALGIKSVRFNIAWRTSMWTMVDAHTLSIPYAGGNRIDMPVVLLESTETGRRAWFANFHNPADTPRLGNNARWRAEAAGIEVAHLTALHAEDGHPVIVTGDFNERAEIFCRFTAGGVFTAAAGGSSAGGCAPPPSMQIDWIFGSTGVAFDGYAVTDTGSASDHNMVHAQVTLTAVE